MNNFDYILLNALDTVFSDFGIKNQIYYLLEKKYGLNRQEIPDKIASFIGALDDIFGQTSTIVITKLLSNLHEKLPNLNYCPKNDFTLRDYLNNVKAFVLQN
jgi:hypothetical protein